MNEKGSLGGIDSLFCVLYDIIEILRGEDSWIILF